MKMSQDPADATAAPALLFWSRLIQCTAAVVIVLSLILLLAPRLGEAVFNLVYSHQVSSPVEVVPTHSRYSVRYIERLLCSGSGYWRSAGYWKSTEGPVSKRS